MRPALGVQKCRSFHMRLHQRAKHTPFLAFAFSFFFSFFPLFGLLARPNSAKRRPDRKRATKKQKLFASPRGSNKNPQRPSVSFLALCLPDVNPDRKAKERRAAGENGKVPSISHVSGRETFSGSNQTLDNLIHHNFTDYSIPSKAHI